MQQNSLLISGHNKLVTIPYHYYLMLFHAFMRFDFTTSTSLSFITPKGVYLLEMGTINHLLI